MIRSSPECMRSPLKNVLLKFFEETSDFKAANVGLLTGCNLQKVMKSWLLFLAHLMTV